MKHWEPGYAFLVKPELPESKEPAHSRFRHFRGRTVKGLLLEPKTANVARVVAIPYADVSPEMLAGLAPGTEFVAQFASRSAENGCLVVILLMIDRSDIWSGIPGLHMTNQPIGEGDLCIN